jgi:hypothetical protein
VEVEEGEIEYSLEEVGNVLGEVAKEVEDGEGLIGDGGDNEESRGVDDEEDNTDRTERSGGFVNVFFRSTFNILSSTLFVPPTALTVRSTDGNTLI